MKQLDYLIRPALESDFAEICQLYRQIYQTHYQANPESYKIPPELPITRGAFIAMLEDANELFLSAESNQKVVGFLNASVEEDEGNHIYQPYIRVSIDEVVVTPSCQNQGIGQALLRAAEDWAKSLDIKDLTAIVYQSNQSAMQLFKQSNYSPLTVRLNKEIS